MKINLTGHVALVTGAGRGIGKTIADTLVANGAQVIYSDINYDEACQSAAQTPQGTPLRMDVSSVNEVAAGIAFIEKKFGRLDILVNNAGVNSPAEHRVTFDQFSIDEWNRILSIDLNGVFLVSREAVRLMIPRKYGSIVNISSVLGVVPARLQCPFTAAKAGVVNLTRTMAIEMGPNDLTINCVAPGTMTNTGFYDKDSPTRATGERLLSHVPLARPGKFEDVANAVLFFAAPENRYVTGQTLCVDGGWTAGGFFRDF
jgi:3-oxoacyl-[acyl-carrier protein] reductase